MPVWNKTKDILIISLTIATLIFAFLAWTSSKDSGSTSEKSLNETQDIKNEVIQFNQKLNETNDRLGEIGAALNLTNTNIQKLEVEKPIIQISQASRQGNTIGSQLHYFCNINFFDCTFNGLNALDNFTQYSVTYLNIENKGKRTSNLKVKIYYTEEKEIMLMAKSYFSDDFSIDFNPIIRVITLEIDQLDTLSRFSPWIFIKESDATGNMINYKIEYTSDEISYGEGNLAL